MGEPTEDRSSWASLCLIDWGDIGKGTSSWEEVTILPAVPVDLLTRGIGKLVCEKGDVGVAGGWLASKACSLADSNSLHFSSYALRAYPR